MSACKNTPPAAEANDLADICRLWSRPEAELRGSGRVSREAVDRQAASCVEAEKRGPSHSVLMLGTGRTIPADVRPALV
jgi:hypothetical protein